MDLFVIAVFLVTLSFAHLEPIRTCTNLTMKCPITKELWDQRYKEFPCYGEGFNYTCIQAIGGILVEACSYPYTIKGSASMGKCPFFIACDGIIPVLGIEANFKECPEDIKGCPGKHHPNYTVNEMYKYPACIVTDWKELMSTSTTTSWSSNPDAEKSSYSRDSVLKRLMSTSTTTSWSINPDTENNSDSGDAVLKIVIPISICGLAIFIVLIAVYVYVRRHKVNGNTDEECVPFNKETGAGEDPLIENLKAALCEKYYDEIQMIPASPLQKTSRISMHELFSPVSIREDLEYKSRGRHMGRGDIPGKRTKSVNGPHDMFYIEDKITANIFMIGDAGYGKSVLCLRLLDYWRRQKGEEETKSAEQQAWVKYLHEFHFVFLVRLRRIDLPKTSLIDMICHDLFKNDLKFHNTIRYVLSSEDYRCLAVIDGLDEAKLEEGILPNTEGMTNCTFFWTSRPWKLDEVSNLITQKDRVVEIHGLTEEGVQIITENILVNHLGLQKGSPSYEAIEKKTKDLKMRSIMKIPLMAMTCIELWHEKETVGESMTSLYVALLDLLIKRAFKKQEITNEMKDELYRKSTEHHNVPSVISGIIDRESNLISVISKLGRIAYDDLVSGNTHLVFKKTDLENVLKENEILFALQTGLLSKCEAAGSGNIENVSISFFHKSMQECLASIYIEMNEEVSDSFCSDRLTSVEKIMKLDNVLIFLSGLNPKTGHEISQQIVKITDGEMCKYRELRDLFQRFRQVELLYEIQVHCYRECKNSTEFQFQVSDINIRFNSGMELIRDTVDILTRHPDHVRSLWLEWIPNENENGVSDCILTQFLNSGESLRSLCINGPKAAKRKLSEVPKQFYSLEALVLYHVTLTSRSLGALEKALKSNKCLKTLGLVNIRFHADEENGQNLDEDATLSKLIQVLPHLDILSTLYIEIRKEEDKPLLVSVLGQLKMLQNIYYYEAESLGGTYNDNVVEKLCTMTGLRTIGLHVVKLDGRNEGIKVSPGMENLEQVTLYQVDMTQEGWEIFMDSILDIKHEFHVRIIHKNNEAECFSMVHSCENFQVVYEEVDDHYGDIVLAFRKLSLH